MTCAIIDDEPLAAELLAAYTKKTTFLDLVGVYNSAVEAMRTLRTAPVDLLFLDIQMPELSGLEFATILPQQTMIIFTTAFDRYAVDSYRVNCVGYLLKPIAYEAFLEAANRALAKMEHAALTEQRQRRANCSATLAADRFIYVKNGHKMHRIFLDDILYIEGLKDYVCFHLRGSGTSSSEPQSVMCIMNMRTLEEGLPQPEFMRVHRSYIVHLPLIDSLDRTRLFFGDIAIPISENCKDVITRYVSDHTLQ